MSNNPSSNFCHCLHRLTVSYKGEISFHFDLPSLQWPSPHTLATVSTFMSTGCGCHKLKLSLCTQYFSLSYVEEFLASCMRWTDPCLAGYGHHRSDYRLWRKSTRVISSPPYHGTRMTEKRYTTLTHKGKPICFRCFDFFTELAGSNWIT